MVVDIVLFAHYRDYYPCGHMGAGPYRLELPEGADVRSVAALLGSSDVARAAAFANRRQAPAATVLRDGDRLALLPAVAGG